MPKWRKLAAGEVDEAIASDVVMLDFFQDSCAPCHVLNHGSKLSHGGIVAS